MAGSIEVTFRCNLKCAHCYVVYDPSKKELPYQEICNIINQIIQEGCLWLLITGGEPLELKFSDSSLNKISPSSRVKMVEILGSEIAEIEKKIEERRIKTSLHGQD